MSAEKSELYMLTYRLKVSHNISLFQKKSQAYA